MYTYDPNSNQQENSYQQGNPYERESPYGQNDPFQQENFYEQPEPYINNGYGNYGGNSTPQKAPNIFQQFIFSFIPTRYNRLTKVKTGSMIGFVTLLALVATLVLFLDLALNFPTDEINEWVKGLPDFEIRNGQLSIEEDFTLDESGMFVYITDDVDMFSYDDMDVLIDSGYDTVLLIGRDRVSLMQDGKYQQHDFKDLQSNAPINKDWIIDTLMPALKVIVVVGFIAFFVGRIFWYFLCAAVYLVLALIISAMLNKRQPAGALFRTAVYSKVLMFVVGTVLTVLPIAHISTIPFLLRVAITIAVMVSAIANLPKILNR